MNARHTRHLLVASLVSIGIAVAGCRAQKPQAGSGVDLGAGPIVTPAALIIDPSDAVMDVHCTGVEELPLKATVNKDDVTVRATWNSSNKAVLLVNKGMVKPTCMPGMHGGTVEISAI